MEDLIWASELLFLAEDGGGVRPTARITGWVWGGVEG